MVVVGWACWAKRLRTAIAATVKTEILRMWFLREF
jgi:hypothetical protein